MYDPNDGGPVTLTANDDAALVPGESTVGFICAANTTLPADYHYEFRIWEPCGSDNHDTPLQSVSTNGTMSYDITLSGDFAVQCAVCPDGGSDADCNWEAYTPSTCN
jgi:long-subunit fatty acid transport protein